METVFDLASPEELVEMFGEDEPDLPENLRGYEDQRQLALKSADYNFSLLASLYAMRDDMQRADEFAGRIQDVQRRLDTQLFLHELESPL
jgi:hypothetical protein